MNKITIAAGVGAAAMVLAGCGPKLAQVPYGSEEERWQKVLRDNYSGYEAPRTAPPAIRDNVSPRLIEEEQARKNAAQQNGSAELPPPAENPPPAAENPPPAADDPAATVDKAAERPAVQEPAPAREPAKQAAPAQEEKKPAAKEASPKDVEIYEVKKDDTLGDIAKKFYGDARRVDVIIQANPALKKDPNFIKAGMKLNIPKI